MLCCSCSQHIYLTNSSHNRGEIRRIIINIYLEEVLSDFDAIDKWDYRFCYQPSELNPNMYIC